MDVIRKLNNTPKIIAADEQNCRWLAIHIQDILTFLSSVFRWLINIFILSEDQSQDWVEKYCRSIIDLCSRLIIFIILKQRRNVRGGQEVWSYVKAVGLLGRCFHQSRWIGIAIPDEHCTAAHQAENLLSKSNCSTSGLEPTANQLLSLAWTWVQTGISQGRTDASLTSLN